MRALARCPGGCGGTRAVVVDDAGPHVQAHVDTDGGWCWGGAVRCIAWSIGRRLFRRWRAA